MFAVNLCFGIWDGRVPLVFLLSQCVATSRRELSPITWSFPHGRPNSHSTSATDPSSISDIDAIFIAKNYPLASDMLYMPSTTRCLCSCTVWTSALWEQGSGIASCFKMATRKRSHRAEIYYCKLERDVGLKAEKIRQKIPEKMDQEKFSGIEESAWLFDRYRFIQTNTAG